jgi:hypothetical protein
MISRVVVKGATRLANLLSAVLPQSLQERINKSFDKPEVMLTKDESIDAPAFDLIRASVNLMVAGILIAIATSMKLPLSTTYVTFMVAMGTSFADRAWGRESAVYRVAGVLNVIGGWFGTAIGAFIAAGIVVLLINWNPSVMTPIFLLGTVILLYRNFVNHKKGVSKQEEEDSLRASESSSLQGVIHESAANIAKLVKRTNSIYTKTIVGLAQEDVDALKKNKKQVNKLSKEVDELRDNIFYFIKNLDESSLGASNFYINILAHLQDMTQSLQYISKVSYKHVNNNHKKLKLTQIRELNEIDARFETFFATTQKAFKSRSFEQIGVILGQKTEILDLVSAKIQTQVKRTRTEESSPKNTTLYFSLLLETKDLLNATMLLLEEYKNAHNNSI